MKAAIFLAVFYAFVVIAPHAAMAFGNPQGAAHCLTLETAKPYDHGQSTHSHADGTAHTHAVPQADDQRDADAPDKNGPAAACCGLFSGAAMLMESRGLTPRLVAASSLVVLMPDAVEGQGPARIDRPPIV